MGLDFTWLGLEKSDPPSLGDSEKPDPNANPGSGHSKFCLARG